MQPCNLLERSAKYVRRIVERSAKYHLADVESFLKTLPNLKLIRINMWGYRWRNKIKQQEDSHD
ncbi:MAG: hypothetical protein A2231_06750 [Candidatus Firestonebacteria bacterium RIFOXYA2_FULL_40_8]|nr:MAG: hypothetical protein A2231_06750 [Candidatus Firestonebacteria bacterium RIFOXYA2_FULL_40_8]